MLMASHCEFKMPYARHAAASPPRTIQRPLDVRRRSDRIRRAVRARCAVDVRNRRLQPDRFLPLRRARRISVLRGDRAGQHRRAAADAVSLAARAIPRE